MNKQEGLPPEIEEGNIEYKRHVNDTVIENIEKLTKFKTQLLWRLSEAKQSELNAIYYLGIEDNGTISGLTIEELNNSIKNFTKIVKLAGASITSTQIEYVDESVFAKIFIHKYNEYNIPNEITVGLLGGSNNGKSSFLGVLTFDIKDDGNGLARSNILKHDHEKQNGMTSSIKHEIIGYDDENYINYNSHFLYSWEYIVKNSKSIINFIDLPGNYKYIKTTLFGIMSYKPDYVLIFDSLDTNTDTYSKNATKLHIELCEKLEIPYTIIFTKKDLVTDYKEENIAISNVTGEGIDSIKELLRDKCKQVFKQKNININKTTEFIINDIIIVPDIGNVLTGILKQGKIKIKDTLLIGPCNNTFYTVNIISIHKKQMPSKYLYAGESGTIVIQSQKINITKNMMLISQNQIPYFKTNFKIYINEIVNITPNSKFMAFCRNIYDSIIIQEVIDLLDKTILSVKFSNIQYILKDEFIILKNNNEIIVGKII